MADKTTTLKTKTGDNVYPNIIGDNMDNAIADSPQIKHTLTAEHKINLRLDNNVNNLIDNSLQKPAGLTKTKLVGVGTNGQENIEIGDNLTLANGKLSASGGGGSISVIELTDKNGTIASTQLSEINDNPQNFAFKYKGKILLFTSADSTTYQYCNNTTSSSDNNVMTTSTLLKITLSTGVYTIAENVHNVVANSIHPANGGDLTNIQVGSKVYSIPSGGGGTPMHHYTIIVGSTKFHYDVYTTKDYGYEPRNLITVWDFKTNDKFKELRSPGYYPASGTWKDLNTDHIFIANWIEINSSNKINLCGYDITETGTPSMSTEFDLESTNYQIIQNY